MPIPEPAFLRDIRMQQMVDERVDMWMTQRITPVLAYLESYRGELWTEQIHAMLIEGLS